MSKYMTLPLSLLSAVLLTVCSGCGKEKNAPVPQGAKLTYSGRIICPRCRKKLQINLPEVPHERVSCTKCKFNAPAPAFCPDLKRQKRR
jgi:hypothetical protein